jgi:hypothetical protein
MMSPMREIVSVRRIPGEPVHCRFRSDEFELIIWLDEFEAPAAFQLCYGKSQLERALSWTPEFGFLHTTVDDGESVGLRYKATPMLAIREDLDANRLRERFLAICTQLPADVAAFVDGKITQHPRYVVGAKPI